MTISITVEGLDKLTKNFKHSNKAMKDALSAAVYQESLDMIAEAKKRTPVKHDRLRGSAYAAPPTETAKGPEGEIGYGTNYAVYVHEVLDAFHNVGGPKFLESVMNERKRDYKKKMADRTADNYNNGIGVKAIPSSEPERPKR
jgi:hypothetical protein